MNKRIFLKKLKKENREKQIEKTETRREKMREKN
jgi:hypothetical protein